MNSIVAADRLDGAVDRLADTVEAILREFQDIVCTLEFEEAEAIAETLEAARRPELAARFMHRWALTEPDWDAEHGDAIRRWLAIDVGAARAA